MGSTLFVTVLLSAIALFIRQVLFAIGKGLCWIVGVLADVLEIFAGLNTASYTQESASEIIQMIKIFFAGTNVNIICWAMALIGIVICFGFTIFKIIKKMGNAKDKMKQKTGDILRNCFKGITLILLMNLILTAAVNVTSTILNRIDYFIANSQDFDTGYDVTFDSEDYDAMTRCLNTIADHSLNASYNNRYNLNACYNEIRDDLKILADKGIFDVTYVSNAYDDDGSSVTLNTWQSVLQNIYRSVDDITAYQPLDEYNTKLSASLLKAMDIIKNDASFAPLEKYHVKQSAQEVGETVHLDRVIMLLGSMHDAGKNSDMGSVMTDYLRGPYYYGQKNVFSYSQVSEDFDMEVGTWLYLTVIIAAILFIKELLAIVCNAAARILNILLLYISGLSFITATSLNDEGKLKKWTAAFFIQSLGLFGIVISLRLVMLFIPVIFSGDIQLFESARADVFIKIIIMYAVIFTARKAGGMIVSTFADNALWQPFSADEEKNETRDAVDSAPGHGKMTGKMAMHQAQKWLDKLDTLASWSFINTKDENEDNQSSENNQQQVHKFSTDSKTDTQ